MKKIVVALLALLLMAGSSLTALAGNGNSQGTGAFKLNPHQRVKDLRTDDGARQKVQAEIRQRNQESKQYAWQFKNQGEVRVNGTNVNFDVPPVVRDGRTLVPLRAIAASLKAEVEWDPDTGVATITRGEDVIQFMPGDNKFYLNGVEAQLDVPLYLVNSRTFVPLRALAELFGTRVGYDDETGDIDVDEDESATDEEDDATPSDPPSDTTPTDGTDTTVSAGEPITLTAP